MGAERPVGRGRAKLMERLRGPPTNGAPGRKPGEAVSSVSAVLKYPTSMMGRLVGKGGSKIRELREASGAGIDVSEEGEECVVKIRGNQVQTDQARKLVDAVTGGQERTATDLPGVPVWGSVTFGAPVEEKLQHSEPGELNFTFIPLQSLRIVSRSCNRLGQC